VNLGASFPLARCSCSREPSDTTCALVDSVNTLVVAGDPLFLNLSIVSESRGTTVDENSTCGTRLQSCRCRPACGQEQATIALFLQIHRGVSDLFFLMVRQVGIVGLLSVAWLHASISWAEQAKFSRRPNLLVILADDLGYGDIQCFHEESKIPTPHLNRLASEGIRFLDAHSPSTVCTPTRYSLLTGRMAFRTGYRGVFTGVGGPCLIEDGRLTLSGMLQQSGYRTAMSGKWHVGMTFYDSMGIPIHRGGLEAVQRVDYTRRSPDGPVHRGFDQFFGTVCCPTTDWLYAYVVDDHIPVPPTKVLDRALLPTHPWSFDNRPGMVASDFDLEEVDLVFLEKSQQFLREHAASNSDQPFFLFHSMQAVHLPSFPSPSFQGKTGLGPHADFIFEMDHVVGELMSTLRETGLDENTLVIFTSDNGPEVGTVVEMRGRYDHDGAHPWRGMKRDNWEGGHRVPTIAWWPSVVEPGSQTHETICLTDIFATVAELLGVSLPNESAEDSFSFYRILTGESGEAVRPYTLHQTISLALAIRKGKWKYLNHQGSGGNSYARGQLVPYALPDRSPSAPGQLYDLEADPGEKHNLYEVFPEVAKQLKQLLDVSIARGRSAPVRNDVRTTSGD